MGLIPDEGKSLPPPGIANVNSVYLGMLGWCTAMLDNGFNQRPPLRSGVHRQVLLATIGWFCGYHVSKYASYVYAKMDRDVEEYMKLHPERFPQKQKRTYAEIIEPFCPIR
ncbi:NADH dehydrogenase [ubiquinone] 1 subunit C2 [Nematolebias whitei]|uniref:NADH dehydrogenase [ubiquinone] 1 subunit C2 n=1 Tax=Nematolebias whitei TaxID=451745 RepID=UPI001899B3F6|nr:NADH dehydrogenase [ubiquinone] 1 subunit C2 [Nematolebias whitei]